MTVWSRIAAGEFGTRCVQNHFAVPYLRELFSPAGDYLVQIEVTCRHGEMSDLAHDHIIQKSEKLLTFFERVTAIQITVDFEHGKTGAEILVDAEHKHNFVSHAEADDIVSAYDAAFHKMEQQLKKYKEKIQDHRRDLPLNEALPGLQEESEEKEEA